MAKPKKKVNSELAFIIAILIGMVVGKFIKKMTIGLLFGVLLFLFFMTSYAMRKKN